MKEYHVIKISINNGTVKHEYHSSGDAAPQIMALNKLSKGYNELKIEDAYKEIGKFNDDFDEDIIGARILRDDGVTKLVIMYSKDNLY